MRTKLIEGLKKAIYALQKDTVMYDWSLQTSCNCGVVAQAMIDMPQDEFRDCFEKTSNAIISGEYGEWDRGDGGPTWKECVQRTCSVTGKTSEEIFQILMGAGLLTEDLVHLEYLDNPAILAESGIETEEEVVVRKRVGKKMGFWKNFLDSTDAEYIDEVQKESYDYYKEKDNLILYLQAWVRILEKEPAVKPMGELSKGELHEELLRCEYAEDYDKAAKLRDLISVLV